MHVGPTCPVGRPSQDVRRSRLSFTVLVANASVPARDVRRSAGATTYIPQVLIEEERRENFDMDRRKHARLADFLSCATTEGCGTACAVVASCDTAQIWTSTVECPVPPTTCVRSQGAAARSSASPAHLPVGRRFGAGRGPSQRLMRVGTSPIVTKNRIERSTHKYAQLVNSS
jgi:hypothetical protein